MRLRDRHIAAVCSASAFVATVLACVAAQGGRLSTSAMVRITRTEPLAAIVPKDGSFQLANPASHYDGAYYYAIAHDPFALWTAHKLIDQGAYRYGHPLYGWVARLLTLGLSSEVPDTLFVTSVLAMALAAWFLSRLAVRLGASPWLGMAVAVSPGLLSAATVDTPEPLCVCLMVGGLLAWSLDRWALAGAALAFACFGKEQFVAVPFGLAIFESVRAIQAGTVVRPIVSKAVALGSGPVALALWYTYIHGRFHRWSFDFESGNLGRPFAGWMKTFELAGNFTKGGSFEQVQLGAIAPPILVALAVLFACAAVKAARVRSVLDVPLLLMIAIVFCQGWRTLLFPRELLRTPAAAVLLSVVVLLAHAQAASSGLLVEDASQKRGDHVSTPPPVHDEIRGD